MTQSTEKTIAQLCLDSAEQYGDKSAFAMWRTDTDTICKESRITYKALGLRASRLALLLRQLGIESGDRVLLLSDNCPEWPLAYFGIALAGAVSVPLLTGFSSDQVQHIAEHSGAGAIILGRNMTGKTDQLPPGIVQIFLDSLTAEDVIVSCKGIEKRMPIPVTGEDLPQRSPHDLAVIIYTSGTSGNSKGVMLSGANLISCALSTLYLAKITKRDRVISVLPLAHAYECSLGMLAPVIAGADIYYLDRPPSASVLLPAAKVIRPTVMAAVPVFLEKMYRNAIVPKLQKSKLYRVALFRPLVISIAGHKLKTALGGKIRFFGVGGAPLAPEAEKFLRQIRFPYAIGYGLTEAAPLVAGTVPNNFPLRSTGTALPGVTLRIAAPVCNTSPGVGEIEVTGPNVMLGYYRNEEQTREAFTEDGWLRTGDLGRLDSNGLLYICGRIKSLILSPNGENIYPEEIEGLLSSSQLIEEALVYSSEGGELVALVRLSDAAKAATTVLENTLEELRTWANKKLASFSRLSKILVQQEPFEKTPTMKIKRYLYPEAVHVQ